MGAIGVLALGGAAIVGAGGLDRALPSRLNGGLRAGLILVAIAAAAVQIPTLVSLERTRASDDALARGDLVEAKKLADEAVSAEPWAGSPYAQRALVLEADGRLGEARSEIERAISKEPTNWRHPLILGRIDAVAGDRQAVKRDLARVRELAPRSLFLAPDSPYRTELQQLLAAASEQGG